jgi:hypothetical protein
VTVKPLIVAVAPWLMWKTRPPPPPDTDSRAAPGPEIVTSLPISIWPDVNVIGLVTLPANVIVLPGHALNTACRKLPRPLSALVVTTRPGIEGPAGHTVTGAHPPTEAL